MTNTQPNNLTYCWASNDETTWWLVLEANGEPIMAWHHDHGATDARRDSFRFWRNADEHPAKPSKVDAAAKKVEDAVRKAFDNVSVKSDRQRVAAAHVALERYLQGRTTAEQTVVAMAYALG